MFINEREYFFSFNHVRTVKGTMFMAPNYTILIKSMDFCGEGRDDRERMVMRCKRVEVGVELGRGSISLSSSFD